MEQRHAKQTPDEEYFAMLLDLAKRAIEFQTNNQQTAAYTTVKAGRRMAAAILNTPKARENLGQQFRELAMTDKSTSHLVYRLLQGAKVIPTPQLKQELGITGRGSRPKPNHQVR